MISTKDLEYALEHGKHVMDEYLEIRGTDDIVAEIKALIEQNKAQETLRDKFAGKDFRDT